VTDLKKRHGTAV